MRYLKLTLAYDGTRYLGWQIQPQGPTVQGVVEEKLSLLTKEEIKVVAAGRTDAGVHALGQVINFATRSNIPLEKWPLAANSVLPPDIAVLAAEEVDESFHARFSARAKTYVYLVLNTPVRDVFWRYYAYHVPGELDLAAMQAAARLFEGTHDFYAFSAPGRPVKDYRRTVFACRVEPLGGGRLKVEVTADGFLYQMARRIVGTLLLVGKGKISPEAIPEIIASRDRRLAGGAAPPHGLFLKEVHY